MYTVQQSPYNDMRKATLFMYQENVATLERWPLVGGRDKGIHSKRVANICGHIRQGGLCREWPLREGPLHSKPKLSILPCLLVLVHAFVQYTVKPVLRDHCHERPHIFGRKTYISI